MSKNRYPSNVGADYDRDMARLADDGCPWLPDEVYRPTLPTRRPSITARAADALASIHWPTVVLAVAVATPLTAAAVAVLVFAI